MNSVCPAVLVVRVLKPLSVLSFAVIVRLRDCLLWGCAFAFFKFSEGKELFFKQFSSGRKKAYSFCPAKKRDGLICGAAKCVCFCEWAFSSVKYCWIFFVDINIFVVASCTTSVSFFFHSSVVESFLNCFRNFSGTGIVFLPKIWLALNIRSVLALADMRFIRNADIPVGIVNINS